MSAPAFVQSAIASSATTVATATLVNAVTPGNTLLAFSYCNDNAATYAVNDNTNSGNYINDATGSNATIGGMAISRFSNTAGALANTLAVTTTLSANFGILRLIVWEVSGLDIATPLDQVTSAAVATSTAPAAPATGTLALTNEFVVSFSGLTSSQTWTVGSGFTLDPTNGGGFKLSNVEYQLVPVTAAVTGSFTISGSAQIWIALAAAYKPPVLPLMGQILT